MKKKFISFLTIFLVLFLWGESNYLAEWAEYRNLEGGIKGGTDTKADFDSLNVAFVGNWPFGDSYAVTKDTIRDVCFLGSGGGVYILDVSNNSSPIKLSEKIHTRGIVRGLYYDDTKQRLYIAAGEGGLEIWDVSNLSNPVKLSCYFTPDSALDVYVSGRYAYVVDYGYGLRVIDINSPTNPIEVGYYYAPGACKVYVLGRYAYVADRMKGLRIIDITNLTEIGFYNGCAVDVHVSGIYAYVTNGCDLLILDISDPTNPKQVGYYHTTLYDFEDLFVTSNYAYLVNSDDNRKSDLSIDFGKSGLTIIDISDPTNPTEVGFCYIGFGESIFVSSNYAYFADSWEGLRIIDISNPTNPTKVGLYDTPSYACGVYLLGSYAYVADGNDGLRIIDISSLPNPKEVGFCYTGIAENIFVSGNYAYVSDNDIVDNKYFLRIIDISSPTNPTEVGYYGTVSWVKKVYVLGSYLYVSNDGLIILDISDPTNPTSVGYYDTPGNALDVYVSGSYAYVADGEEGLRVIDISDPTNPTEVGYCDTPGLSNDLYVFGNYAYVADYWNGLRVIDISDPTNPTEVGYCDTPGYAIGVYVSGSYAYVADWDGLRIIDISSPTNPTEVGYYVTVAFDVYVTGGYAFVAGGYYGLETYKNLLFNGINEKNINKEEVKTNNYFIKYNVSDVEIYFGVSEESKLDVSIYDKTGRELKKLYDGKIEKGYRKVTIKKQNYPTGEYFIKGKMGKTEINTKVLILK